MAPQPVTSSRWSPLLETIRPPGQAAHYGAGAGPGDAGSGAGGAGGGGGAGTSRVQKAHARAPVGMALRHHGQSRVVDSTSGSVLRRAMSAFTGRTMQKNTAAAISRNAINALRKFP